MQSPLRHGKAAIGTTLAGGALAALSQAPERASRLIWFAVGAAVAGFAFLLGSLLA